MNKHCVICSKPLPRSKHKYCSLDCSDVIKEKQRIKARQKYKQELKKGFIHGVPVNKAYYIRYRNGARKRNIVFALSFAEYMELWQKPCFYCGDGIKYVGIDRQDNSKGYELSNVVPCCTTCNQMKFKQSITEFKKQCKKIVDFS